MIGLIKICKQCYVKNDSVSFHGKICRPCDNRNKLEKKYIDSGRAIPPKKGLLKKQCEQCDFFGDKILFHGKICKKCFRKNSWNNPILKIRSDVSRTVRLYLKKNGSHKNNNSILNFLPYTIQELKEHLEFQFEPWMNWSNWGTFNSSQWDEKKSSTWTWQIDHIIPQSLLLYTSMEDKNFKKCWSLDNLRPLSAKDNKMKSDKIMEAA